MLKLLTLSALVLAQQTNPPALPEPFAAKAFHAHVAYLASDDLGGRGIGTMGSANAMEYIIRHLKEAGAKGLGKDGAWYQDFLYEKEKVTARNVLAVFPGKGALADEAVIVSAHHDHLGTNDELVKAGKDGIFNGADDNASGCAAILLVAQALAADKAKLPESYRTVIFASFDAEERGLLGSRYYVRHPLWPLNKTTANINFDMVGRLGRGKVVAGDSESSAFFVERITALAAQCGLNVETRLHGSNRADNASFLEQAIPAMHFNSGLHSDYHQVTDEASKIDGDGGARISWLGYRLLREVMESPERLRFRRPPPNFDINGIIRLVVKLGIVPEQNTQAGKYPLVRFVMPNSLAAKQGFQANDEITSVNGQKFDNIIEAALLFGAMRLDRDIRLTILRKGETVDLKIPGEALKEFAGPTVKDVGNDQHEVTFLYKPPEKVNSVALAGTFNDWNPKSLAMEGPDADGAYRITRTLTRGTYEYKFVVNGNAWTADPTNLRTVGVVGNSLLVVGKE